jgi:hypothetical protein
MALRCVLPALCAVALLAAAVSALRAESTVERASSAARDGEPREADQLAALEILKDFYEGTFDSYSAAAMTPDAMNGAECVLLEAVKASGATGYLPSLASTPNSESGAARRALAAPQLTQTRAHAQPPRTRPRACSRRSGPSLLAATALARLPRTAPR